MVLGGLENRRFKALFLVTYTFALVIYKTPLLGRFDAFWRHCGGGGLGGLASRENLLDGGAPGCAMRECAWVRVCMCACVRVCVCARIRNPPFIFLTPPYFLEVLFAFAQG